MPLLRKHWRILVASFGLFLLNAYICRELFSIEYIRNLDSNEGVFVALSRFFRESFADQRWFPFFDGGVPIENAYQPLLPLIAAATGWVSGWSVERAFHFVLAMAYCLGPVTLFWFAWDWSRSLPLSFTAALAYSLTSFAELLIPILRVRENGHWAPLRLYNLVHYAEDPHNLALTLLPLALLFLRRAGARRSAFNIVPAVVFCGAVVMSNGFGAVDLALGGICVAIGMNGGFIALALTGVAAYMLISPWMPPALIALIGGDQWTARGSFSAGFKTFLAMSITLAAFGLLWWTVRRLRPIERFSLLFAVSMCPLPLAWFLFNVALVPQSSRYQLELEMALCLVAGVVFARAFENLRMTGRVLLAIAVVVFGVRQAKAFRHYARGLIQPVEISQTIEYKTVRWLDRNLPGQRVMISGDVQFLNNVLTNNPQLGGGHEPTVPNWMDRVAVYTVYSDDGAGDRGAEFSIFWLKAFGVQAITVPGETSRENYHPVVHPHKFDGILPVLWHEEDDTIFVVPQRSKSLAHVVPKEAISTRRPIHGLDIDPVRAYVAALDDPALPPADLKWYGNSQFQVRAPMRHGQVLSVQVTYMPAWKATVSGRPVPVHGDGIGLMVIEPGCEGSCTVDVAYGVTAEAWICRILSALVIAGLMALAIPAAARRIFGVLRRATP